MAGHSKWANIKHKKAAQDSKRSKIFQKISKEIMVAIKEKGNNPDTNAKLRLAIEKAKASNIPNDNIKKLLEKSEKNDADFNEITYEGYGPGGVAFIVETLTDNVNRTAASIKSIFNKGGGNLGTSGSVSYLFETEGIIIIDQIQFPMDQLMEKIIELNIVDLIEDDDLVIIKTNPSDIFEVGEQLKSMGINEFVSFEVEKNPLSSIDVSDDIRTKNENLLAKLEDNDDVQRVYFNI